MFLVSGSLELTRTRTPDNAFVLRTSRQSLIILFRCVLEPSELLASTASCRREFPARGDDLCLAGSPVVSLLSFSSCTQTASCTFSSFTGKVSKYSFPNFHIAVILFFFFCSFFPVFPQTVSTANL